MDFNQTPWWRTDNYSDDSPTGPLDLSDAELWGPKGAALVNLWDDGRTATGWGSEMFMSEYKANRFAPNRALHGYNRGKWNFAWVMRSSKLVCIDIDGKNGGLEHASKLGFLPPTTSETSKSGNGYHLFYLTDDTWDPAYGFQEYRDHIGIVEGVDVRGTGCVYHYPAQRWNTRSVAVLPDHLKQQLRAKHQQIVNKSSVIQKTLQLDPEEIAMMHFELLEELQKPVPVGKRNNTLFAIGSKLKAAEVEGWDDHLVKRAIDLGLDGPEIDKLVKNIESYA